MTSFAAQVYPIWLAFENTNGPPLENPVTLRLFLTVR